MENKKGKFIVLYGTNNLGKTTQAKMLVERLLRRGYKAEYIKYPIYDSEPAGKLINEYYRLGNPHKFTARESQLLHFIDRISFEPHLKNKLNKGINIVAEDYFGTAVAWGLATGVDFNFLKYLYSFVYPEDLPILFDGVRFKTAIEKNHHHEADANLINKARFAHLEVAQEYGWHKINANQPWQNIHQILWDNTLTIIENPAHYFIAPNFKELHDQIYEPAPLASEPLKPLPEERQKARPKIKILRLSPLSRTPLKTGAGDYGFYLFVADYYSLPPRFRATVKTDIKIFLPDGYVGLITNIDGTGDNGYVLMSTINSENNDVIKINILNPGSDILNLAPGQKIAKLIIQKTEDLEIEEKNIYDL